MLRKRRCTHADYRAVEATHGFIWLDDELPRNIKIKTRWRCPKGHVFQCSYSKIVYCGTGCNVCNPPPLRKTEADYHAQAEQSGIQWIGPEVPQRVTHPTLWYSAAREMYFEDTLQNVVARGKGGGSNFRISWQHEKPYHNLARLHHMRWLGETIPARSSEPTIWQCQVCDYTFETSAHSLSKSAPNRGCPDCSGQRRLTRADYQAVGLPYGKRWAGKTVPPTNKHKTLWQCEKGHEPYPASYNSISRGHGCRHCQLVINGTKASKVQLSLARRIEEAFDLETALNVPIAGYTVDILLENDIVVEYDGWYYHQQRAVADEQRNQAIIAAGHPLLVVRSANLIPSLKDLARAFERLKTDERRVVITLKDWGR